MGATSNCVLVTGGAGFIGTWVLRELGARGLRSVAFDLCKNDDRWQCLLGDAGENVRFVEGSLLDRELLRRTAATQDVTHIIHLAALLTPDCQRDPFAGCEANVLASVALFELARLLKGQIRGFSYASSYAVYGPEADDVQAFGNAAEATHPPTFYGAFKLAVDMIAEQYWRHFGVASVGIRPHVAYGPERTVGLTAGPSLACRAAALGEDYTINYTGRAGYDYAKDVAYAFVRAALETPRGAIVVDLPSQVASTDEFVTIINRVVPGAGTRIKVSGPAIPSNIPPKPRFISELFDDWKTTSLSEGVRATIDYYRTGKEPSFADK